MNGHRHRFRFVDDKRDCDLCIFNFIRGKSKPLCDPVPADCPHIIDKSNGIEDPIRRSVLKEVRNAVKRRFEPRPFYPRHEFLKIIKNLEADTK